MDYKRTNFKVYDNTYTNSRPLAFHPRFSKLLLSIPEVERRLKHISSEDYYIEAHRQMKIIIDYILQAPSVQTISINHPHEYINIGSDLKQWTRIISKYVITIDEFEINISGMTATMLQILFDFSTVKS